MWFGTYDGLNLYNGKHTYVFRYDPGDPHSIDGNIIRKIIDGGPGHIWVSTIMGLNRISISDKKVVQSYSQYPETYLLASDFSGHALFISSDNYISYFSPEQEMFHDIFISGLSVDSIKELFYDGHKFYLLTVDGLLKQLELDKDPSSVSLKSHESSLHTLEITHAFYDKGAGDLFFVDIADKLYAYNSKSKQKELIADLSTLNHTYSGISQILSWRSDIYISYMNEGMVRLDKKNGLIQCVPIDINAGVFSLCKDHLQDILWIGTDGQGVNMYYHENKSFEMIDLADLPYSSQKPVRGIYTDHQNTLWVATKGDGIFRIHDYDLYNRQVFNKDKIVHYTTENGLADNQVFCFLRSADKQTLWIGSEGAGLSYYSYKDDKIYTINEDIRWVHSICEINDSVLWLATTGAGLAKVSIDKSTHPYTLKSIDFLVFEIRGRICKNFHSMIFDGDSSLLIGIRGGYGAIRMNIYTNENKLFSPDKREISAIGDVLSLHVKNDSVYYLGTSSGLVKIDGEEKTQFNRKDGIANDMIHGILEDNTGCLWLSTNRGLTKYNPANNLFHNFYHPDLAITEFSDDAYWKCPYTGRLFFGGINGLVWLDPIRGDTQKFMPELRFLDVIMKGKSYSLTSLTDGLVIPPSISSFTISFVATNYINGYNYEYAYLLDNYDTSWVPLQKNNEVTFSNLPYGRYVLKTKYKDDVHDAKIKEYCLPIYVRPPWYLTRWAIGGYIASFFLVLAGIIKWVQKRFEKKQQLLAQQIQNEQKDKLYKAKLDFFTNITHELCTPLTLINGITDNIECFKVEDSKELFKETIEILRKNVKGLNELIQEILDFRKIEESGFTELKIKRVNISEFIWRQSALFLPVAEKDNLNFKVEVADDLYWNTDVDAFKKIFMNLLSNAFKYVSEKGDIHVWVMSTDKQLILKIYNTGIGIEESEIPHLFDRFHVLEHLDGNKYNQTTVQHGLGLFISQNLVQLLGGEIIIRSEVNKYAEVEVVLPLLKIEEEQGLSLSESIVAPKEDFSKPVILVIDDNKDIVWLIKNTLSEEYKIKEAFNASEALSFLEKHIPVLIITDILMQGMNGLDFIRQIKSVRFTRHIPVIIVSAKISAQEQAEGLNLGADIYLTKPFSSLVLRSTVNRLISTKKELKEYYYSPESAYELFGGQLLHQEDKNFMDTVTEIIKENLNKENFGPELIAEKTGLNTRNFYRKFKKITSLSPTDFIKDYRFIYAAQLLITTNLSIQEIIYKVGINNKSYFYREFLKKYQMTPKEYRTQGKTN